MPRDPKDISVTAGEQSMRRIGELDDQKDPIRLRVGAGATGAEGKEGKAGATWYSGTTVPSTGLGVVGDFYLRTTTSDVYKKTGTLIWSLEGNIKGATGEKGATGTTGEPGQSGTGAPLAVRLATAAALPAYTRTTNKLEANAVAALATIDGTAAAVNDLILLKNGAANADNGVYKVVSVGGAAEKWVMERYESMDTSAEAIPGMMITVAAGTKNHDEVYQLTTDAPITLNTTGLTFARTAPRDFGLVAALPTSEAIEGDRCIYKAVSGEILWQCVYDGVGEYPWKVVGGGALRAESNIERELTNQTTYASLATDPLKITAPLKGIYDVTIEARLRSQASTRVGLLSYAVGATAASDNWSIQSYAGATDQSFDLSKTTQQTVAAAAVIEEKAKTGGAYLFQWLNRRLRAMPIRVG